MDMGRPTLIHEKKHPYYFKPRIQEQPLPEVTRPETPELDTGNQPARVPEYFMEQVMEGLSDACMLIDTGDRLVYVNTAAKKMLQPKGRILGRKLASILADNQISALAADAYRLGKPLFATLTLQLPGSRWRETHQFHTSLVPLWITPSRRLVRVALRDADKPAEEPKAVPACSDAVLQMRNPLSVLQGYLENMLDGHISEPAAMRQSLLTMRKHTQAIERLLDDCKATVKAHAPPPCSPSASC
jgi:signal transduction histidine kinase